MTTWGKLGWALASVVSLAALGLLLRTKAEAGSRQAFHGARRPEATFRTQFPRAENAAEAASPSRAPSAVKRVASSAIAAVAPAPSTMSSAPSTAPSAVLPVPAASVESPPPMPLPLSSVATAPASSELPRPKKDPRRVALSRLAAWSRPGLCEATEDAAATRDTLTARFRKFDAGETGNLLLDPRLPEGAEAPVVGLLAQARAEASRRLGLQPPPPQVFVYFDQKLMKAAACINEDVVAFYDGALHLVLGRDDAQQSVTHEYAHHALFSSGLVGPAWAQEGIAMNLAGETWWQQRSQLQSLLRLPFSVDQMDDLIPYKLSARQAVGFYVQAALTVQCLMRRRSWSLQQLADTLRDGSSAGSVSYEFPELADRSFLDSCAGSR